jgi:hypothetical protein
MTSQQSALAFHPEITLSTPSVATLFAVAFEYATTAGKQAAREKPTRGLTALAPMMRSVLLDRL